MTNEITETTTPNSQSTTVNPSRRQFLRTAAIGAVLGLAGCLSAGSETGEATPTAERQAIEDISFEGEYLVLTATEEFHGTELHVVDPTETVWAKTETEPTTGKARIRLLDVDSYDEDNHYTPGIFRFVFEPRAEDPQTERVELVPDVSIIDIRSPESDEVEYAGRVAVEIKNSGDSPTWISEIVYEDAPNYAANDEPDGNTSPTLYGIEDAIDAIIYPGEGKTFFSGDIPFIFPDDDRPYCVKREYTVTVIVTTPRSQHLRQEITVERDGEPTFSAFSGEYVCSDVKMVNESLE